MPSDPATKTLKSHHTEHILSCITSKLATHHRGMSHANLTYFLSFRLCNVSMQNMLTLMTNRVKILGLGPSDCLIF